MRLGLAVAALLVALTACGNAPEARPSTGAPDASAVEEFSGESTGKGKCGDFELEWVSPELGGEGPPATLTARAGEERALDVNGRDEIEQLTPIWCGDVTGDGRVEFAHLAFSGGAHCCWRLRIDTLDGPTLLDRDLGNSGDAKPEQLDGKGPLEIVSSSDILAYFDLPYVASPFLPLAFAYRNGRYVEATADFPAHIRGGLENAWDRLAQAMEEEFPEAAQGAALGVFGHYVLLDQPDEGLEQITTRGSDELARWVRERQRRAATAIRTGQREEAQ